MEHVRLIYLDQNHFLEFIDNFIFISNNHFTFEVDQKLLKEIIIWFIYKQNNISNISPNLWYYFPLLFTDYLAPPNVKNLVCINILKQKVDYMFKIKYYNQESNSVDEIKIKPNFDFNTILIHLK